MRFVAVKSPLVSLPGLKDVLTPDWHVDQFGDWVQGHGKNDTVSAPIGRLLSPIENGGGDRSKMGARGVGNTLGLELGSARVSGRLEGICLELSGNQAGLRRRLAS